MIKIAVIGDIGSGKSYVAKQFGFPVFDADAEVAKLYKQSRGCYRKLKKKLPAYITSFPIIKSMLVSAIISNKNNLKEITRIVHPLIRKRMNFFLKKNKNKKIIVLDIPLLLENKINKKKDILVFVQSKKSSILRNLKKRKNFNKKLLTIFKSTQLPLSYKKKKSHFIIKNNFTKKSINDGIKSILKQLDK